MAITANGTHIIFNDSTTQATQGIEFASGTSMLFRQNTAPTGWTKSSSFDNATLRIVSGTINQLQAGVIPFTGVFANNTPAITIDASGLSAGATTLSTTQIPSHTHPTAYTTQTGGCFIATGIGNIAVGPSGVGGTPNPTGSTGGGSSHSHSMSGSATGSSTAVPLAVRYVDSIIAAKD
jgi:hypothetical protein